MTPRDSPYPNFCLFPRKVTPRLASKIKEAHDQGTPMRQIARDMGVSPASVHAAVHGNAGAVR